MNNEKIDGIAETRYLSLFDYRYAPDKHYYIASRHSKEMMICSRKNIKSFMPDAVTIITILISAEKVPRLLLQKEYRYPVASYLLSPPAGLIDKEDLLSGEKACITAAKRELLEETGIIPGGNDKFFIISKGVFSSPGMTDESNALVCAVISETEETAISHEGATGGEVFDGFVLINKDDARRLVKQGTDDNGICYSVYTWCALMFFVSDLWLDFSE